MLGGKNLGHKYWGGQKFGSQILGDKNFWQIYFQAKNLEKFPSILSKISDDLFFSHRQLFYKIDTFHSKCTRFSLYCCLCFCFLSCLFFINKQNYKILVCLWGGRQKRCFVPILIIGGACPGCPQSLRL